MQRLEKSPGSTFITRVQAPLLPERIGNSILVQTRLSSDVPSVGRRTCAIPEVFSEKACENRCANLGYPVESDLLSVNPLG